MAIDGLDLFDRDEFTRRRRPGDLTTPPLSMSPVPTSTSVLPPPVGVAPSLPQEPMAGFEPWWGHPGGYEGWLQEPGRIPQDQLVRTPVVRDPDTGRIVTGPILPAPPAVPADDLIFTDPATRMLEEFTRGRFRELQGPAFSATEENQRRAGVFDQLERQRQMAKRQAVERLATMGHARTSGIFEETERLIDEQFNRMRSERERDLALEGIGRRDTMQREALALASLLPELVERRLGLATSTLTGAAPNPASLFQQLAAMVGQTQQQEALESQRRGSGLGALGQLAGLFLSNPGLLRSLGIG